MIPNLVHRTIGALAVSLLLAATAQASSLYDAIYVFGDSLSDVGNDFITSGGTHPGPPYANGQFSNGPIWLQTLAGDLGLSAFTPSLSGGTDYAYGGAQSGAISSGALGHTANNTDLIATDGQIAQFQATHVTADPNALYTIEIGTNDLGNVVLNATTKSQAQALLNQTTANIDSAIQSLITDGARHFLVMNIGDLGKTPAAVSLGAAANGSLLAAALNGQLDASLAQFASGGATFTVFDTYGFLDQRVGNPGLYGLTNVTDPCYNATADTICSNPNQYLFWDTQHPTAGVHGQLGAAVFNTLTSAVPVPASAWLLLSGVGGLALMRRRTPRSSR